MLRTLSANLKDWAAHSPAVRNVAAVARMARRTAFRNPAARHLEGILAYQIAEDPRLHESWGRILQNESALAGSDRLLSASRRRHGGLIKSQPHLTRSLLLKGPGEGGEKGVLLVMFEYNWLRMLDGVKDWKRLTEEYDVILGSSWSPTDYGLIAEFLRRSRSPLWILPSHLSDVEKFRKFSPRIRTLPLITGTDFLLPEAFAPLPHAERETDILMVANWAPFKRHYELFRALRSMPKHLRVTLIGQREGRYTSDHIRHLARENGVPQDLEILESLSLPEVHRHQCKAKISLILSKREGGCVAAAESLFAGSPLGMRRDAHVGAIAHINPATGTLFAGGKRLPSELGRFLETSEQLRPREWAEAHISCRISHAKLNQAMREEGAMARLRWGEDLALFCWHPYPAYVFPEDGRRLFQARMQMARDHPGLLEVGEGPA
jgi:glycosyltransferase involved in cell wall biosynthesis